MEVSKRPLKKLGIIVTGSGFIYLSLEIVELLLQRVFVCL